MKRVLLLIDDDRDIRDTLAELFEDSYHVLVAPHGLAALEILLQEHVDVIILDLMMALMDGETLLEELRERGWTVPVILLSAGRDLAGRARALGVKGYCAKPCPPEKILAEVARVLADSSEGGAPSHGSAGGRAGVLVARDQGRSRRR